MRDLDLAVVGGGLAGLTAAAFAGRAGLSVAVFERASALGGRAQTRDESGFLFNLGPHALYRGGEAVAALRALGVPFTGGGPPTRGAFAIRGGEAHTLPVGTFSMMATGLLPLSAKLEAGRILARLPRRRASDHDGSTETEWLESEVRHEGVRELIGAFLRLSTYAHDPGRQSAGAALAQLQLALRSGVLYLDGGWQTLVDGLRAVALSAGAEVLAHRRVEAIEARGTGGFEVGVHDCPSLAAKALIVATPPAEAARLLTSLAPETRAWADAAIPVRAATLDLALDRLPRPEATFALGMDEPLYASVHSRSARLAPGNGVVFQLARYGGPAGNAAAALSQLEALAEALQPGYHRYLRHRRFLPDLVVSHALVRADRGGLAGRPDPALPGVAGAFVAGDWVGSRGMLADAALASAREAAGLAVAHVRGRRKAA